MNKEILNETYKKLVLTLSILDTELKQTQKIHDLIKSEFASAFTKYCYDQDAEFFDKAQQAKEEKLREEEKRKEWEQKQCNQCKTEYTGSDYTKKDDEDVEIEKKDDKPKDVKKLYRKIVMLSHPDKNEDLDDDEEKARLTVLYKEATKAYNDVDMSTLIRIAVELGLNPPDPTEEQLKGLHDKVNDIKLDIATIEHTVAWVWYYSNEEERQTLIHKHYENVRKKNL